MNNFKRVTIALVAVAAFVITSPAFAWKLGGQDMVLKGKGARKMAFLTVYYASLNVPQDLAASGAKDIIDSNKPMTIIMTIDSKLVTSEKFVSAVRGGFANSASAGYTTPHVNKYLNMFNSITIVKGDVFFQNYVPGKGLTVVYKSKATGKQQTLGTVKGLGFKKAFYAMFIGPKPISDGLKSGMLGK